MIAFESQEKMDQLIKQTEANHREYMIGHQNYPSLQLKEKRKDIYELEQKQKRALEKMNVADVEFSFNFYGVYIRMNTNEDELFSEAVLEGVSVYYIARPMDFMFQAQLVDCSIFDYSRPNVGPNGEKQIQNRILFTSKEEKPKKTREGAVENEMAVWINVIFKAYGDNHPYFQQTRTKSEVDIRFSLIRIEWRQELLNLLINFFIQKNIQDQKSESDKQTQIQMLNKLDQSVATAETESDVEVDSFKFRKKSEGVDIIFMRLSVVFEEFSLLLLTTNDYYNLASFDAKNLSFKMVHDNMKILVEGCMENMKLLDLTNYQQKEEDLKNINPFELIGLYGSQNSAFEFQFLMHKEPKFITDEISCEMEIHININKVKITWIQQPFMRLINYLTKNITSLLNAQKVNAPSKADEKFEIQNNVHKRQALIKKTHQLQIIQINLTVNHPRVVLKPKIYSNISFEFDFGIIKVSNKFHPNNDRLLLKIRDVEYLYCQSYHLETSGISFSKICTHQDNMEKSCISRDFGIDIVVDMIVNYDDYANLSNTSDNKEMKNIIDNSIKIEGKASQFLFKLTQEDYSDLMDAIFGNILYDDKRNCIFGEVPQPEQPALQNDKIEKNEDDDASKII